MGMASTVKSPLPPPPGLKNVGNSCYATAALHCLLSTALPHALLSERNAHIIRRHSFNRKLLISGSGSVDSDEEDDADSVYPSDLSGISGLCSVEEDDVIILARAAGGVNDSVASSTSGATTGGRGSKRRDDGTVASYDSKTSSMYHDLKKRHHKGKEPSEADLLCLWLTQELTQITREYTTPPQQFTGEKHRQNPKGGCSNSFILGSFFRSGKTKDQPNRVVDPGSITRHVQKISPCLQPYQQEDAHEFLRSLLSTLTMNGQNARLSSLFDGLLESSVTCNTCRKSSLTSDMYMDLSLDIADRGVVSLEKALAKFIEEEILEDNNKVTCSRCKVKRTVTKGLRLATVPTMLVINFKRFAYDKYGRLSRLSKQVTFPLRLELKEYMSRANRGKPPPYSLVAVLVHRGRSCNCGHYFAYVRKGTDWYLADDAVVTKVDVEEVLSAQAYVLVYEVEGMKEKHIFDCYSTYHRSFNDLENVEDKAKRQEREKLLSWDLSAFTCSSNIDSKPVGHFVENANSVALVMKCGRINIRSMDCSSSRPCSNPNKMGSTCYEMDEDVLCRNHHSMTSQGTAATANSDESYASSEPFAAVNESKGKVLFRAPFERSSTDQEYNLFLDFLELPSSIEDCFPYQTDTDHEYELFLNFLQSPSNNSTDTH